MEQDLKKDEGYRVYYLRYNVGNNNSVGVWENITKDFKNEDEANLFIRRIKQNIIVKWYVKSKIFSKNPFK